MNKKALPKIDWLQEKAKTISETREELLIEKELRLIIKYYDALNYDLNYNACLWRGRKCSNEQGYNSLKELHYPPAAFTRFGRVNDLAMPILYVSFTQFTALAEVRAQVGDIIQFIGYRQCKPIKCLILGEFANVNYRGQCMLPGIISKRINDALTKMKFEPALSFLFLDAFLASLMAKQEIEGINYVHSRVLSRLLFEKYKDVSAVQYSSVARMGAMNLAIKPNIADIALAYSGTSIISVTDKFDFGLYRFSEIKSSTNFGADLMITWDDRG